MAGRDETADIPLSLIGDYPDGWEASTLGKACSLVTDGTHDSPKKTQTGGGELSVRKMNTEEEAAV